MDAPRHVFASYLPARIRVPGWRIVRTRALQGALLTLALFACHTVLPRTTDAGLPNVAAPTAGGQQFWSDIAWRDGWRIQRHAWTGHARLLDETDVRRAWGSETACHIALDDLLPLAARARTKRVVVVLHGLWRTRGAMSKLKTEFEVAEVEVVDVAYASTRRSIDEHAATLAELLNGLPGEGREISFVTHSLGALITRALLARQHDPWRARHALGRAVFIAPPNGGASLAQWAKRIPGALLVYGKPSREIAEGIADTLPSPPLPFATIAAGRGTEGGWNPLIPGDDDGVVGVSETHLEGEAASLFIEGTHTFVMRTDAAVQAAVSFITTGVFPSKTGTNSL